MVIGSILTMSTRLPTSPVTQTLEPPSTILVADPELLWMVMDDSLSAWTPQTRGEQTMWVTLLVREGRSGRLARREADAWVARRSTVTDVGEGAHVSPLRRLPRGHMG
jgi:hypothetical protein